MSEQENLSEVARIKRQIELEYEAAQRAMYGFAVGVAKHEFITARMEKMGRCHEQLVTLVGEREATKALAQALEQAGQESASSEQEMAS